jgi:hypothetical protein
MVRLTILMVASRRDVRSVLRAFRSLAMGARIESGSIGHSAWSDPDFTVHYFEEWATKADMERRIRSESFTLLLAVMEASREPPLLRFEFITSTRGLDYVAEVRQDTA